MSRLRNPPAFERRYGPLAALRSLAVALRCLTRSPWHRPVSTLSGDAGFLRGDTRRNATPNSRDGTRVLETILTWVAPIGYGGIAILVVAWLVVSFTESSPRRAVVEWLGAFGLYVALLSLFSHLLGRALESDSTLGMIAFGFLAIFFAAGLLLCAVQVFASLRAPRKTATSATN